MSIVGRIRWSQRNKLARIARKSREPRVVRRALAMSQLARGQTVAKVAEAVCAARSTIYQWAQRFVTGGIDALHSDHRGSERWTMNIATVAALEAFLETTPLDHGYLRSRWSSELLAKELQLCTGIGIHASTVRRALGNLDWVWRRARPTLHIADPRKAQRLRAIARALTCRDPGVGVYYQDEAEFDLNPRIGPAWRRLGAGFQEAILTPGQNRKAFIAGALHAHTGKVV